MYKLISLTTALALAFVVPSAAFAGDVSGRGNVRGTGSGAGTGAVAGQGSTCGEGRVVYRDSDGDRQTMAGEGCVDGTGVGVGEGAASGTGRGAGQGSAEGRGSAGGGLPDRPDNVDRGDLEHLHNRLGR